jgi:hypothetical protein
MNNYPDNMDWQAHDDAFGYPHEVHMQPQSDALLALGEIARRLGWDDVSDACEAAVDGEEARSDADTLAIANDAQALRKVPVSDLLADIIKGLAKQAEDDAKLAARIAAKAAQVPA